MSDSRQRTKVVLEELHQHYPQGWGCACGDWTFNMAADRARAHPSSMGFIVLHRAHVAGRIIAALDLVEGWMKEAGDSGMKAIETPPAWAVAAVDQRIAMMMDHPGSPFKIMNLEDEIGIVMLMLTEPSEGSDLETIALWENACDNCYKYCPEGILTGAIQREIKGIQVVVVFGSCPDCAGKT